MEITTREIHKREFPRITDFPEEVKETDFPEEVKETDVLILLQEAKDTIETIKNNLRASLRTRDDAYIKQTVINLLAIL